MCIVIGPWADVRPVCAYLRSSALFGDVRSASSLQEALAEDFRVPCGFVLFCGAEAPAPEGIRALREKLPGALLFTVRKVDPQDEEIEPQDIEILRLVAEGLSNAQIAPRLFYSENTIKYRVSALMARFHLNSRVQLAVYAVRNNII